MTNFDPMNVILALAVFAAIVIPFAWWTTWQQRRNAKRQPADERKQVMPR
jgi:type VI protein secretion system component VasK